MRSAGIHLSHVRMALGAQPNAPARGFKFGGCDMANSPLFPHLACSLVPERSYTWVSTSLSCKMLFYFYSTSLAHTMCGMLYSLLITKIHLSSFLSISWFVFILLLVLCSYPPLLVCVLSSFQYTTWTSKDTLSLYIYLTFMVFTIRSTYILLPTL